MKKIIFFLFLIFFDFSSKKFIFNNLELNSFISILFFLDIIHIHNYGLSFGLFSGFIPYWIVILLGSLITILIFIMYLKSSNNIEKWAFFFIISGAVANILDRLMNKYVLDFIYFHYEEFYWPAFNFADIYITLGVIILLFQITNEMFKKLKKENVS